MKRNHRQTTIALFALSALAAAPAFAQRASAAGTSQETVPQSQPQAASAATTSADASAGVAAGVPTQSATQAGTATAPGAHPQQSWEEVDADKDGAISKAEAAVNPDLLRIFAQADADADGRLTAAEYKDFVAKNYGDSPQAKPKRP